MDPRGRSSRRLPALVVAAALLVVGVAVAVPLGPREPVAADAPPDEFSADRAARELPAVAGRPHPTGSAANTTVREYLTRRLTALGLPPRADQRTAAKEYESGAAAVGRVTDLTARIPGTASTGRVLLVAHYDSVAIGPGAGDDGLGVTAILEIARILVAAGPQRNDIDLLLTDGEESGLLGARAFTDGDRTKPTVVLNLEARGTSGPVVMFETGDGNSAVLPALRGAVPVATSVSDEVYRLLPNDTDFTEFRRAGFTGMNFAVVSGSAHYHTPTDSIANADRSSLQDMGTVVLSATRRLAAADLADGGSDATYFTLAGLLVSYPMWLALPLAGLALVGLLAVIRWRRRAVSVRPGVLGGLAAAALFAPVVAGALGYAAWPLLLGARPHFDGFFSGDPYRPGLIAAGLTVVAVAVALTWLLLARRRARPIEVPLAVALLFAFLGVVTAVLVPGVSYLFTWPALAAALALALVGRPSTTPATTSSTGPAAAEPETGVGPDGGSAGRRGRAEDGAPWRTAAVTGAIGVTGLALFVPIVVLLFPTMGLILAAAPMAVVALLAVAALPLPPLPRRPWPAALPVVAVLVVGLVAVGSGIARNAVDADHPAQVSLVYTRDADTGASNWAGGWGAPEAWLEDYVDGDGQDIEDRFPTLSVGPYRLGPAPAVPTTIPEATVLGSTTAGDVRTVRLRLRAAPGETHLLGLYVDTSAHELVSARVDGATLAGGRNRTGSDTVWKWGTYIYGTPAAGIEVELAVRGSGPVPVRLVAHTAGLPTGLVTLPPTLTWTAQDYAGETVTARTVRV